MSISFIGGQLNCNYRLAFLSELCVPLYQFNRIKMLYCYVHTLPQDPVCTLKYTILVE